MERRSGGRSEDGIEVSRALAIFEEASAVILKQQFAGRTRSNARLNGLLLWGVVDIFCHQALHLLLTAAYHPYTIRADGRGQIMDNVVPFRAKATDTEKITINLGYVDLGQVDLLVREGFYSNRTDFIRTAIRNQLQRHEDVVKASAARKSLDLGLQNYTRARLEAIQRAGQTIEINVLGLAVIASDVTPELAQATISSVTVLNALHASPDVKAALAGRIQ